MRSTPPTSPDPDQLLADFRAVVEQTNTRLVRLAARILGDVREAEDVVQEAYVRAYQAMNEGRFEARSSVATWLYRIVTRGAIDAARGRRRRERLQEAATWSTTPGVADERLALRELSDWLSGLPKDQHAALLLRAVEGFTTAEVATILECSAGAVEQRLVRARATLRRQSAEGESGNWTKEGRSVDEPR